MRVTDFLLYLVVLFRFSGAFRPPHLRIKSERDEFLAPDQYVRNAQIREDSLERVEFAIRLPGGSAQRI
jgi:hypothetical protein